MAKTQSTTQLTAPASVGAPVMGLNTRDSLAMMKPLYAIQLDNFFPFSGECVLRGGATVWAQHPNTPA
jgi:hypothetical protein